MSPGTSTTLTINRAPVLTLWAAIVAERLGFDRDEALTLGHAMAGRNALGKGRALGIYLASKKTVTAKSPRKRKLTKIDRVELLGVSIPTVTTPRGVRAVERDKPADPRSVERYHESMFGGALCEARSAMAELARAFEAHDLAQSAFAIYQDFRPKIPSGAKGWGAAGLLDLGKIRAMAKGASR
jgi:hypothetical protein